MCGIFCAVSTKDHVWPSQRTQYLLEARGPDAVNRTALTYHDGLQSDRAAYVSCFSTVLSLRGSTVVCQPYQSESGGPTLCWNGEAWSVESAETHGNDTIVIHKLLQDVTSNASLVNDQSAYARTAKVAEAMSKIAGPYAFVFYDQAYGNLYFGRDPLGRRSLLRSKADDETVLILSSVVDSHAETDWDEVEADGVYCLDLKSVISDANHGSYPGTAWGEANVIRVPYETSAEPSHQETFSVVPTFSLNREIPSSRIRLDPTSSCVIQLEDLLIKALMQRTLQIPEHPVTRHDTDGRVKSSLAILFSGGLDCTVLARMTHDILPTSAPIDLLNVAFENPRVHKTTARIQIDKNCYELCPDRITGRKSHHELCRVCPTREWRFVPIDIPYSETQDHRQKVMALMYPHNTEMDLSISLALYFAARGTGRLKDVASNTDLPYSTSARVLLSGLGADELFGGYTRHATAFNRNGFVGLLDELDLDIGRLGRRNLGRDDRVISNWAKEVRFPFLAESLVNWALAAPVTEKCGFGAIMEEPSERPESDASQDLEPGKKVLRCLAQKLGMFDVAQEKKRAIQFGARTAKMETGRTKGTQILSSHE